MKLYLLLLCSIFSLNALSLEYKIDPGSSDVKWHLFISSSTDVYGAIPIDQGSLNLEKGTGVIMFKLEETKSFELENKEKEYNSTRDARIYDITNAKDNPAFFSISQLVKSSENNYEIHGQLTLNKTTNKVKFPAVITQLDNKKINLKASYKLDWQEFKISNPVVWITRIGKKADRYINLDFDINASRH